MTNTVQTMRPCPNCGKSTLHINQQGKCNHLAHGLVTLFLFGFWAPVWIIAAVNASRKTTGPVCTVCGGHPIDRVAQAEQASVDTLKKAILLETDPEKGAALQKKVDAIVTEQAARETRQRQARTQERQAHNKRTVILILAGLGFILLSAIISPFRKGGDSTGTTAATRPVAPTATGDVKVAPQPSISDLAEAWAAKYEPPTATPEAEVPLGPVAVEKRAKSAKSAKSAKPTPAKAKASKKTSD